MDCLNRSNLISVKIVNTFFLTNLIFKVLLNLILFGFNNIKKTKFKTFLYCYFVFGIMRLSVSCQFDIFETQTSIHI